MDNEKKYFFDNPNNVKRLLHVFYGICVLLFVLDFVIHRHVMHSWENLWGFYPLYGFVGCVVLVLIATWMRTFLMRSEDYYDKEDQADIDEQSGTGDSMNKKHHTETGGHDVDA